MTILPAYDVEFASIKEAVDYLHWYHHECPKGAASEHFTAANTKSLRQEAAEVAAQVINAYYRSPA